MIDIRFRECCCSCYNLEVQYDQVRGCSEMLTVIGCSHACVCAAYNEEEPEEDSPPDVTVKGFCNADG